MKKTNWISFLGGNNSLYTAAVALLITLTILVMTQINFIFTPLVAIVSNVLMPFIIAVLLYYLLVPLVSMLSKTKIGRTWSVAIVFVGILALLGLIIAVLVPLLQEQVTSLIESMPAFIDNVFNSVQNLLSNLPANDMFNEGINQLQDFSETIFSNAGEFISQSMTNVTGLVSSVTNVFFTIATAPIILFFLLKDEQKIVRGLLFATPPKWRRGLIRIGTEINIQVGAYIKGQFTIAVLNGIMMYIGFTLIGLNYSGALGLFGGVMSLIPYIGPTLTFVPAALIAVFDSFSRVLMLIGVWMVIQFIEGNLVEPNIMGKQLKIHPLTIIVTLLVMGDLFGLFGLVFGIPMYAILKVIAGHFFGLFKERYNHYFGHESGEYDIDIWDSDEFGDRDIEQTKEAYVQFLYNENQEEI